MTELARQPHEIQSHPDVGRRAFLLPLHGETVLLYRKDGRIPPQANGVGPADGGPFFGEVWPWGKKLCESRVENSWWEAVLPRWSSWCLCW
jgi:hypothetical protein